MGFLTIVFLLLARHRLNKFSSALASSVGSRFLLKQIFAVFRDLKKLLFFEEFEVFFWYVCYDICEAKAFDSYDDYAMGFVVFYLTSDAGK